MLLARLLALLVMLLLVLRMMMIMMVMMMIDIMMLMLMMMMMMMFVVIEKVVRLVVGVDLKVRRTVAVQAWRIDADVVRVQVRDARAEGFAAEAQTAGYTAEAASDCGKPNKWNNEVDGIEVRRSV